MDQNYPNFEEIKNVPPASSDKDALFGKLNNKVKQSVYDSSRWGLNQVKWHRLRMRIKKVKTFPFEGCSNLRMPTGETKLKKLKASLINVLTGLRPVVQVVPSPGGSRDTALKIEKFLDHMLMDVIKIKGKMIICVDQMLEKGFQLMKPFWNYEQTGRTESISTDDFEVNEAIAFFSPETPDEMREQFLIKKFDIDMNERVKDDNMKAIQKTISELKSGSESSDLYCMDVICDYPDVALASPERVYVPADAGYNPQDSSFLVHEFFLPLHTIRQRATGKGWDKKAVDSVNSFKGVDITKQTDIEKDLREGITRLHNPSELVKIWEYYGWYDLDNDGEEEKVMVTMAPEFSQILRKISIPFDNGKFPFVKFFYELTDDRWFSHRGIIEIMEDIIKEIDIQHMSKLDNMTIRNAPMFVYRAGMVNPNNVQFIPNQGIPVHGMNPLSDTLALINNQNPNVDFSYEREEQILEMKIQELIGQIDFSLQSMINRRQPRTLGEVNQQVASQQSVFTLDSDMVVMSFEELCNWVWDLWCQYGNDEYEFAYFGKDGWEPIRLTKEEIQGNWKIAVRGNDQNTNPQVQIQKASQMMQMATNPVALQTGVVNPQIIAETYKRVYQALDIEDWEKLVNMNPQPVPPPQEPQKPLITPKFDDLADGEQMQVLQQLGVQPDVNGRLIHKQHELLETHSDHADKMLKHHVALEGLKVRGSNNGGQEK